MINKISVIIIGLFSIAITGCMYRSDGVFKQIGNSDYKAQVDIQHMFVAADGPPITITGTVVSNDLITPLKYMPLVLRKKNQREIITKATTDNAGRFALTGLFSSEDYTIEIDSPEYTASKTILVEPNRINSHEIFARRK